MKLDSSLPLHPTALHPLTGQPLRAVYVDSRGRARYPFIGAAEDDPPADPPKQDDPPADPPADPPKDLGFPKDTPVAEMTTEQQVAYYKHQSRKHEERATEYRTAAGGKTAAEVKAGLESADELRRQSLTDQQKAVEDAEKKGREETAREYAPKAARAVFELALKHVEDKDERSEILDAIDVKSVITASGDIDTDKVSRIVARLAPAGKAEERRLRDFGAGDRKVGKTSGVAAGRSLFQERHGKKSETTTS